MSIPFSKARDPKLGLTDKLTFGKFKDCRLCDIIQDHFEYLLWLKSQSIVQLQQEVLEVIEDQVRNKGWEMVAERDSQDDIRIPDTYEKFMGFSVMEDDVPF